MVGNPLRGETFLTFQMLFHASATHDAFCCLHSVIVSSPMESWRVKEGSEMEISFSLDICCGLDPISN